MEQKYYIARLQDRKLVYMKIDTEMEWVVNREDASRLNAHQVMCFLAAMNPDGMSAWFGEFETEPDEEADPDFDLDRFVEEAEEERYE